MSKIVVMIVLLAMLFVGYTDIIIQKFDFNKMKFITKFGIMLIGSVIFFLLIFHVSAAISLGSKMLAKEYEIEKPYDKIAVEKYDKFGNKIYFYKNDTLYEADLKDFITTSTYVDSEESVALFYHGNYTFGIYSIPVDVCVIELTKDDGII